MLVGKFRPGSQANSGDLCVEDLQTLDEEETAAVAVPRFWQSNYVGFFYSKIFQGIQIGKLMAENPRKSSVIGTSNPVIWWTGYPVYRPILSYFMLLLA